MSEQESQSLKGLLYIADAYATRPALKVRGKEKSASFYGLIFTFLVLGCLLAYCYHLAFDLLNYKHPAVFSCDQPGETINNDLYVFTQDTFQMGFGLVNQTTGAPYMDNSIYTVKASLKVASPVPNTQQVQWNIIPLDIEPCKASHASWDQKFTLSGLWCFKEQQSAVEKVYVRGADDSFINIEFSRCDPKTSNVTCSSAIDAQLRKSIWQAYYTDWAMNPNLYKTPMIPIFQPFKAGLPSNLQRKVSLFLKTLLYETDAGWLTEESGTITAVGVERINYDFDDREEDNPVFMSAEFINSGNLLMHMRRYKKLAELFAQVEGLAVVLIPILGVLVFPYSTFKMYEQATNDIYNIQKGGSGNKKRKGKRKSSTKIEFPDKESELTGTKQLAKASGECNSRQKSPEDDAREVRKMRYLNTLHKLTKNEQEKPNHIETLQKLESGNENKNKEVMPEQVSIGIDFPVERKKAEKEDSESNKESPDQDQIEVAPVSELKPFSLSYFEWLKSFCRSDPRMKVIAQARDEIEGSIDVVGILKRFLEIDKLKECLLTQEQRVLFDNLRRPILTKKQKKVSDKNKEEDGAKMKWQASYAGDIQAAERVYQELESKKCKTELDKKILALYEERNCGFTEEGLYQ